MPPTQSRRSYTAAFKLEVAIYAEENGGNMAAQRKYGVSEKVIGGWRKQKDPSYDKEIQKGIPGTRTTLAGTRGPT